MEIKYGSIEYFMMLDFRDRLTYRNLDKLDLEYLDRLRGEIDSKIAVINYRETERINKVKNDAREARESGLCSDLQT
jgi:hypothetical protein